MKKKAVAFWRKRGEKVVINPDGKKEVVGSSGRFRGDSGAN